MKRKKNIIDDLSIRMRLEEVADEELIVLISEQVQDLEMGDRDGRTLLWHTVIGDRRKVAEWLVEHGANINTQDDNSFSALHLAAQEKNIGMVTYLLQNGADVNIRDKFGNTPIMRTNRATPVELLHILLQNGADVDIRNIAGVSYRDVAVAVANPDVLELLKEYALI